MGKKTKISEDNINQIVKVFFGHLLIANNIDTLEKVGLVKFGLKARIKNLLTSLDELDSEFWKAYMKDESKIESAELQASYRNYEYLAQKVGKLTHLQMYLVVNFIDKLLTENMQTNPTFDVFDAYLEFKKFELRHAALINIKEFCGLGKTYENLSHYTIAHKGDDYTIGGITADGKILLSRTGGEVTLWVEVADLSNSELFRLNNTLYENFNIEIEFESAKATSAQLLSFTGEPHDFVIARTRYNELRGIKELLIKSSIYGIQWVELELTPDKEYYINLHDKVGDVYENSFIVPHKILTEYE